MKNLNDRTKTWQNTLLTMQEKSDKLVVHQRRLSDHGVNFGIIRPKYFLKNLSGYNIQSKKSPNN
jgi:hypothetical protein